MTLDARPLTADDHELVELARRTVDENSDGDVGVHTMGAAVREANGRMFAGINLHHFTGGPCAELATLAHARASGARDLVTIVAVGDYGRGVQAPCGRCRQVLADYFPHIRVIIPTGDGVVSVRATDLLPLAYQRPPD